ncbi:MAG TPA: TolC family protein, partial [Myxococcota bacterium]|nr:TolC family protein [Myxococcota bacterium]
ASASAAAAAAEGEAAPEAVAAPGHAYSLTELLAAAEGGNLDVVAAGARLAQAEASVQKAWASLLPVATLSGAYTRNQLQPELQFPAGIQPLPAPFEQYMMPTRVETFLLQKYNQLNGQAKISVPVLVMPAYFGIASARQGRELAELGRDFVRGEVSFGIAQAYYGAVGAHRFMDLRKTQAEVTQEQEKVARAQFEAGQVPKIAFLRVGVDRAQAEQELRRAQNAYASAKLALVALTGVPEPFEVAPPPPMPKVLADADADVAVQRALEARKDLAMSHGQVEIAERTVTQNYWRFAPAVVASGEYDVANYVGLTGRKAFWLAQVAAKFSLFDADLYADIHEARAKAAEAAATRDNLARRVVQEVKTALLDLESAQANLTKATEQQRLAEESAELVKTNFEAGIASYLDVVDASGTRF